MKKLFYVLLCGALWGCGGDTLPTDTVLNAYIIPKTFESEAAPPKTARTKQIYTQVSPMIFYAQKVIDTEAAAVGTSCSHYVRRVLKLTGFAEDFFVANTFNQYAAKNFRHYQQVKFNFGAGPTELQRLKLYLWSYPERTPFIMQWIRPRSHGHVAFVERVGQHLLIYQASLNSQLPHKDQTRLQTLLSNSRKNLIVYSEM